MDSKTIMKGMMELFKQMDKALDEIEERQRRWLDPKRKVRPKKQIEERKSTHFDFSFLHSFPMPESTKSKQIEPSKSISVVREAEKSKPEVANFSTMAKNVQEEEQQNSDFSEVLPMEENVQEEEQQHYDFSGESPKEENVPEEEKHDYEFSDDSPKEQIVPEKEKCISELSNVFSLQQNVMVLEEAIDFIFPIPIVPTNHALDLRTNLFQEEGNDTNPDSIPINSIRVRVVPVAMVYPMEYDNAYNKMVSIFGGKINTWRPIELNYAQWGLCKVFRELQMIFTLGSFKYSSTQAAKTAQAIKRGVSNILLL